MFCFDTEIGTENRGFSLVLVPNTEILVPWQHYMGVCTVYFYYVYINTHKFSIYFENIYMYLHVYIYIHIIYIIYKYI